MKELIDVGAHKGEFLSYVIKINSIKKFYAFEPQASIFRILKRNFSNNKKVNLILSETISLPISFIIGLSFISGSLTGSLITTNFKNQKQ